MAEQQIPWFARLSLFALRFDAFLMIWRNLQLRSKQVFVVLHHVIDAIHIRRLAIHTVEHRVIVLLKFEGVVSQLTELWMVAGLQTARDC